MLSPTTSEAVVIARIGALAARFVADHSAARVVAVFERSMYLECDGDFICLGTAVIGDGPINAVASTGTDAGRLTSLSVGQRIAICDGVLHAGRWRADCSQAAVWQPRQWPSLSSSDGLRAALARVQTIALEHAPLDGLAPPVFFPSEHCKMSASLHRLGAPRIAVLDGWIADRFAGRSSVRVKAPVDLLGLGPGLTPSGDDLLCGVLIALDAVGARAARASLASAVLNCAAEATTPLSAQFLASAAEGMGAAALHNFIAALIGADLDSLPAATTALGRIGHTSGWDALAGAFLALTAWGAAPPSTRSP